MLLLATLGSPLAYAGNSAPTIKRTPLTSVAANKYYWFCPTATDADKKDRLTFSVKNKPSWAVFDSKIGSLSGTPKAAGTFANIVISVSDGKKSASLPAFSIKVTGDSAPVISGTPGTTAKVGAPYAFQPSAKDPDGTAISFSIANKPSWASFSIATGKLSGTPTVRDVGTYKAISITVSSGKAKKALPSFQIQVAAQVATAPKPAPIGNGTVTLEWEPPTRNADDTPLVDLAGYRVYYGNSPSALSQRVQIANAGVAIHVLDNLPAGTYYFAVSAYNRAGLESDRSAIVSKRIL